MEEDNNINNKFIGSGLIFPIQLDTLNNKPITSSGKKLIESSIANILNWPTSTKYFNEVFGCRIFEVLEEPDDFISSSLLDFFIKESLEMWEKRIIVLSVNIDKTSVPGTIGIKINYTIISTKQTDTFIFPYYTELIY